MNINLSREIPQCRAWFQKRDPPILRGLDHKTTTEPESGKSARLKITTSPKQRYLLNIEKGMSSSNFMQSPVISPNI